MILFKTKNRVFTLYPPRKPESMETYSVVTFHTFRFPQGEEVKNVENWLHVKQLSVTARRPDFMRDCDQIILEIHRDNAKDQASALSPRNPIFCNTLEVFLHCRRPAVPDARNRAPRHSGAALTEGGRTYDHATV